VFVDHAFEEPGAVGGTVAAYNDRVQYAVIDGEGLAAPAIVAVTTDRYRAAITLASCGVSGENNTTSSMRLRNSGENRRSTSRRMSACTCSPPPSPEQVDTRQLAMPAPPGLGHGPIDRPLRGIADSPQRYVQELDEHGVLLYRPEVQAAIAAPRPTDDASDWATLVPCLSSVVAAIHGRRSKGWLHHER